MLVNPSPIIDNPAADRRDDRGSVLFVVLMIMMVGFIIATVIASAAVFAVESNATNSSNLQAFTAAESGRDAAVAMMNSSAGCGATTVTSAAGAQPKYTATIYATSSSVPPTTSAGLVASCPSSSSTFVVVTSIGTGTNGDTTTIDSVFPWTSVTKTTVGGVVTYFGGGVSTTVSNYIGDLVVRSGNFTCPNAGSITGDLYVTNGDATFSTSCVITGNVYVSGNVVGGSQSLTITGNIIAGGSVSLPANGSTIGSTAGTGNITAGGAISLTNTGNTTGIVKGSLQAANGITVGNSWSVAGSQAPSTPFPGFTPTMAAVYAATQWVDMDGATPWDPGASVNPCGKTFDPTPQLSAGTSPLMLDYTTCGGNSMTISVNASAVTRDAVFLVPTAARMIVQLNGNLTGGHQLLFVHADASRALSGTPPQPQPDCGNGSTNDKFTVATGIDVTKTNVLLYTPCGLTGNVNATFDGQLYSASGSLTFGNGASYTCQDMSWPPAFSKLGCHVTGGTDGVIVTSVVQTLGLRMTQSER